jgi:hypothetical protein
VTEAAQLHTLQSVCQAAKVSRAVIDRALKCGDLDKDLIVHTERGYRRIGDKGKAVAQLKAHAKRVAKARDAKAQGEYSYEEARAKREHFGAAREELRFRTEAGELIEVAFHTMRFDSLVVVVRERMLRLVNQHSGELAAAHTVHDVEEIMGAAVRAALEDIKERSRELVGDVDDGRVAIE